MAPKRKRNNDPEVAPLPKRQTRSSTKAASASAPAPTNPSKLQENPTKKSKKPSSPSKNTTPKNPQTKSPKSKPAAANPQEPTTASPTPTKTTFTINHATLKKELHCERHSPPSPPSEHLFRGLLFTHGAGGTLSAPAVQNFCTGYSSSKPISLFQGSMNLASRVKGFLACIDFSEHAASASASAKENSNSNSTADPLLLGGRSMGARAAVMAASQLLKDREGRAAGGVDLVLVSYPLQGPKEVRDRILLDLPASVNVLLIVGDRDAMCPLALLRSVRERMKAQSWLVVVKGLDHGMHGKGERDLGVRSGEVAADWVAGKREASVTLEMETDGGGG